MADDRLEELIQKLKTERDELRVQMHLAKAELRDEWEELEKKWSHAEEHFKDVLDQTRETAEDVRKAASIVAEELNEAFLRIRDRL